MALSLPYNATESVCTGVYFVCRIGRQHVVIYMDVRFYILPWLAGVMCLALQHGLVVIYVAIILYSSTINSPMLVVSFALWYQSYCDDVMTKQ